MRPAESEGGRRPERGVSFALRWKFVLFVGIAFALAGGVFGWTASRQFESAIRAEFTRRGETLVRSLATNARLDVYAGNRSRLADLVAGALEQSGVVAAAVFDTVTGEILAERAQGPHVLPATVPPLAAGAVEGIETVASDEGAQLLLLASVVVEAAEPADEDDLGLLEAPPSDPGRPDIGVVALAITLAPVEARIDGMQRTMAGLALAIVAGAIVVVVVLSRVLVAPIERIAAVARRIAAGDRKGRAYVRSRDEIGVLADAFNQMTETLAGQERELREMNTQLEAKVRERTAELELKQEQLLQTNAELERASRMKSEFLANMSHELRTPLNAINGFSELLLEELHGPLNDKQRRYLTNVLNSGKHLLGLINNILDLSKIEAGRMEVHVEEFSIAEAIDTAVSVIQPLAQKKNLELAVDVAEGVDAVRLDAGKTRQILYNLLSNAVKFTDAGTVTVSAVPLEPGWFELAVTDTGVGIPADALDRVFREFEQVDGSHSRKYEGTGLGLALTKKMVEMQGGTIRVESRLGEGSSFRARFPLGARVSEPGGNEPANAGSDG